MSGQLNDRNDVFEISGWWLVGSICFVYFVGVAVGIISYRLLT
jgi:hypothetical protein